MRRLTSLASAAALSIAVGGAQTDLIAYQSLYDAKRQQWLTPSPARVQVVERTLRIRYEHLGRFEIEDEYRLRNPLSQTQRLQLVALMQNALYTQPPVELDGALLEWQGRGTLIGVAYPPNLPEEREYEVGESIKAHWQVWSEPFRRRLAYLHPSTGVRYAVQEWESEDWFPTALTFAVTLPPNAARRLTLRYTVRGALYTDLEARGNSLVQGDHLNYLFAPNGLAKGVPVRVRVEVAPSKAVRISPALPRIGVQNGYTVYESRLQRPEQILLVGGAPRELRSFYLEGDDRLLTDYNDSLYYERGVQQLDGNYYAPVRWLTNRSARLTMQKNRYTLQAGAVKLQFRLNTPQATLNGKAITLSAPPRLIDGELHLPLREALFLMYHHDHALRTKHRQDEPIPPPPPLDAIKVYRRPDSAAVEFAIQQ